MTGPLIVPMSVEAMVVNDDFRTGPEQFFHRDHMTYAMPGATPLPNLAPTFSSPEKDFISPKKSSYYNGVYLSWTLPAAFTTGTQDKDRTTRFPLVPNRWLIVRTSTGAKPAAWILESDAIDPRQAHLTVAQEGSRYFKANGAGGEPVVIGRNVDLSTDPWTEPGGTLFLTAVAPGNPAFASYQPFNNNVFSFVDVLNGEPDRTYSYHITGWLSDPAQDPLAGLASAEDFAKAVGALGWTVTDTAQIAALTCCVGTVNGVGWQSSGLPASAKPVPSTSSVPWSIAVGNSSVEALTALVASQAKGDPTVDPAWFEAFQLDALGLLDQPDGAALLQERIHSSFFQRSSGGHRWEIVAATGTEAPATAPTPAGLADEARLLDFLNLTETELEEAERSLLALRRQLYVLWWKSMNYGDSPIGLPTGFPTLADITAQLDPGTPGTVAAQTQAAKAKADALRASLPSGATQAALDAAIAACQSKNPVGVVLAAGRKLKRAARERLALPNNPVVLISGAGSAGILSQDRPKSLPCRFADEIVTGLTFQGTAIDSASAGLQIDKPDLSRAALPAWLGSLVPALLTEWYFTDPANAGAIATDVLKQPDPGVVAALAAAMAAPADLTGTPSAISGGWSGNYWHPLYLLWALDWYPIPYRIGAEPVWTYSEGEYSCGDLTSLKGLTPLEISGVSLLTPHVTFNLKDRIQKFLASTPNLDSGEQTALEDLLAFVQKKDQWDILSQSLDGFNQALIAGATGAFPGPPEPLRDLIGDSATHPLAIGQAAPGASAFEPWRSGQFQLSKLVVLDRFGQAIWLMGSEGTGTPPVAIPDELRAAPNLNPDLPGTMIAPAPGFVQPARLDFDLVDRSTDGDVYPLKSSAEPVCGWIVPNHLDQSIMVFSSAGEALGELVVGFDPATPPAPPPPAVHWLPSPGSPCQDPLALPTFVPRLGDLLLAIKALGPPTFNDFRQAIDETLWTTAPIGSKFDPQLAVMFGRPLAMVRARLALRFDAALIRDPAWADLTPPVPDTATYSLAAELGNLTLLEDGLVGYVTEEDYSRLNVVAAAAAAAAKDPFLTAIGAGNYLMLPTTEKPTYVSMLIDPRASVHARTAILPTRTLAIPPAEVTAALKAMQLSFRFGPMAANPLKATAGGPSLAIPLPRVSRGSWSFSDGGAPIAVAKADAGAGLGPGPAEIWRGHLSLSPGAEDDR